MREVRVNQRIRASQVRIISETGEQLGVKEIGQALQIARETGKDLIEIVPGADPPVCRLGDYGKYKYELEKKERLSRKGQGIAQLKEVRIRPQIGEHDLQVKLKSIRKFLEEGDKVKVNLFLKGRERAHPEKGRLVLDRLKEELAQVAQSEEINIRGRMAMVFTVKK